MPDEWGQGDDATPGDWGQNNDATEMGATVVPTTRQVYRYRCNSCDTVGQFHDDTNSAYSDGLQHEQSMHQRVFTVEAVGTYD